MTPRLSGENRQRSCPGITTAPQAGWPDFYHVERPNTPLGQKARELYDPQMHSRDRGHCISGLMTPSRTFPCAQTAVAIGEIADELSADLVVLSSDIVHKHAVDANLLAEFVSCPILLVPM